MTPNEQKALDYANEVKVWTSTHTTISWAIAAYVAGFLTKWFIF